MITRSSDPRVSGQLAADIDDFETKVQKRLAELEIQQDLITLREDSGLTQSELAEIAGVSQPFIAKLESGRATNFELKSLVRAATALGAEVEIRIRKKSKAHDKTPNYQAGARRVSKALSAATGRH